jgi:hypothetical protein
MAKRHPNPRLVKLHRNYTVEDVAGLFGTHKNTVRGWLKVGLPTSDARRPMLILGQDLAAFLRRRRTKNKRAYKPGEMYCVRCRAPKMPAGDMADYLPETDKIGMLKGICPDCDCLINRRVSVAKLDLVRGRLDITFPQAPRQVSNSNRPTVNSDFR